MKQFTIILWIGILINAHLIGNVEAHTLTLQGLHQYAQKLEEFPKNDNQNDLNPDFTSYLKSLNGGAWKRFFSFLGEEKVFWAPATLSAQMQFILQKSPFCKKKALFLQARPGDELIIWGDIHGAFHSLLRSLRDLQAKGYLSDDLKILKPHATFIFMGNIIDRSPYSLETLSVVLTLMARNPQQVIYLQGSHEHEQNWQNYDLGNELYQRLKINHLDHPFVKSLNTFFNQLPGQIFLQDAQSENLLINSLYTTSIEKLLTLHTPVTALIQSQSRSRNYQSTQGFELVPPIEGIPTWTNFSSPTRIFQNLFEFYNDSYTIIHIGKTLSASKATAYTRDIRSKEADFSHQTFHLLSARVLRPGEELEEQWLNVALGCSFDLSESVRVLGERLRAGMHLRISKLNREGGIHGKLLRIYFKNDKYTPSLTLKNVNEFLKKKNTVFVFSPLGTPTTQVLLPKIQKKEIVVFAPYTGANIFRNPDLTYMFHYRTSYANEAHALVTYAREELFKQKFGFFYQDDEYGWAALNEARKVLKEKYNIKEENICQASYQRNTLDVDAAAQQISKCQPDVLFFFSTIGPSKSLIQKIGINKLSNVTLMGISFLTDRFRNFVAQDPQRPYRGKGLSFIISRVVPNPYDRSKNIVAEYIQELEKTYPGAHPDVDSLEGYINTSLIIEVLKSIPEPITKEKIVDAMKILNARDFKGLKLRFSPQTRELSQDVWLDTGAEEWIYSPSGVPQL